MRIDRELVERGLAPSRSRAQQWIADGRVELQRGEEWAAVNSASQRCQPEQALRVLSVTEDYVSRAGYKLAAALDAAAIDARGLCCLDVGASTGGFTDCLLQRGAARVVCVDVGHDQLASEIAADPRVQNHEGINARELDSQFLLRAEVTAFDLIVMDVSFISQRKLYPTVLPLLAAGGVFIALVKPQFELGRSALGKGGVVQDAALYPPLEADMRAAITGYGLRVSDYLPSPITGGDGNREFLLVAR